MPFSFGSMPTILLFWKERMTETKPFSIPKATVYDAYLRVKAKKGGQGIDNESMKEFEENLKNNLYKIWNRMSSGSYFPPPVKLVDIPKSDGGKRTLGIPTVSDRIAQMVIKMLFEPLVEPIFHTDSYGYRPGKSPLDALSIVRQRCWSYNWVLDLDIKGFFDTIEHSLMMRAVKKHTTCKYTLMYIERWLQVSAVRKDGTIVERKRGTPQGGVISPLLANLFLHYAFDDWMNVRFPCVKFARYADDIIVHCHQEAEAKSLLEKIRQRLRDCKLELHPVKTKIVYCKDSNRPKEYEIISFDFLSYTFRPRLSRNGKGVSFVSFSPAISGKAAKSVREKIRGWKLKEMRTRTLDEVAAFINPKVRGWLNYYGRFCKSAFLDVLWYFKEELVKWGIGKYKRFKGSRKKCWTWLKGIARRNPSLLPYLVER